MPFSDHPRFNPASLRFVPRSSDHLMMIFCRSIRLAAHTCRSERVSDTELKSILVLLAPPEVARTLC